MDRGRDWTLRASGLDIVKEKVAKKREMKKRKKGKGTRDMAKVVWVWGWEREEK